MKKGQRTVTAERGALATACGLLGLSLFKGAAGWMTGSKALLADACQSAQDCAGAVASLIGWRNARSSLARARQLEAAASIVLSAGLIVAALEIGLSAVRTAAFGPGTSPGWGAVAAVGIGIAVRAGLARYQRILRHRIGLRTERPEQGRPDLYASLVALVGVLAAVSGPYVNMPALWMLDPVAGIVISAFVLRHSVQMIVNALRHTEHAAPNELDNRMLLEAVQSVEGVVAVDEVRAKEHGHYMVVDAVIRVNPRISVAEGHDIAMRVRRHLTKRFLHVTDAAVQVQPYDPGYPYKTNHQDEEWTSLLQ